ncbi:MAG: ABC transporter substrate-binding protein [Chloroflexi bacterium]|nr:ABC transporter substrate-binding protein [Chloroflexota bacterium]
MKSKGTILSLLVILTLVAVVVVTGCAPAAPSGPNTGPIVIGYVGTAAGPGTKPCIDAQQMAVEEINAAGGILGRPLKYVVEDNKGETSLAVAGVQRMVMGSKAVMYSVEGRTEISMVTKQKSIDLYKDFPHMMISNGASGVEVTQSVLTNYDKEKMIFRMFNPEPGHGFAPKKWALLYENLAWTLLFRNGWNIPDAPVLPTWDQMAKDNWGIDIVYSKPIAARTGMYLPILDAISKSGADMIYCVSSWFTDTEVLTKQWADSPAKDIQLYLYGGVAQTHDFWQMTGGKANGVLTASYETPITDVNMAFVKKANARGIPVQMHVACAYDDVYLFKAAVEKAGGTADMDKLIAAFETTTLKGGVLGDERVEMTKVPGFFHSRVCADPANPTKLIPGAMGIGMAQYQLNGEMVPMYPEKYAQPDKYQTPAALRAAAAAAPAPAAK